MLHAVDWEGYQTETCLGTLCWERWTGPSLPACCSPPGRRGGCLLGRRGVTLNPAAHRREIDIEDVSGHERVRHLHTVDAQDLGEGGHH